MESLNILISNDDGIFADGIRSLAKTALLRGHKVTVVCPDQERSATGHGLTLQSPIRVERADELFEDGIQAWGCSGTPGRSRPRAPSRGPRCCSGAASCPGLPPARS